MTSVSTPPPAVRDLRPRGLHLLVALLVCALALTMTACGKKSSDSSDLSEGKSSEPLPLSKALTTKKGIWFRSRTPEKNAYIYYALISDGKGSIKYYGLTTKGSKKSKTSFDFREYNLSYKDLKGLGPSEIGNIIKKKSDLTKSHAHSYANATPVCDGIALAISFSAKTDPSGNSTEFESLKDEKSKESSCFLDENDFAKLDEGYPTHVEFSVPSPESIQVYDKNFSGLLEARHPDADDENQNTYDNDGWGLYAMIAPDSPGFTLDPPGTEDVKFDEDEDQQR